MSEPETPTANPVAEQVVLEYQPTDETGNPLGKPTVIKGANWEEVARKQIEVNQQAVRAYHRLKNIKPEVKIERPVKQMTTDEEFEAVTELMQPQTARKGLRKLMEAEFGLTPEDILETRREKDQARKEREAYTFIRRHIGEYFDCEANTSLMLRYLSDNGLEVTANNFEMSFAALQDELAQSPARIEPKPAEEPPAPAANPARRPSATPDIQPGTLNGGARTKKPGLTKSDYMKMARENPTEYKRHMVNPMLRSAMEKVLGA
jgi:hypothetical protein